MDDINSKFGLINYGHATGMSQYIMDHLSDCGVDGISANAALKMLPTLACAVIMAGEELDKSTPGFLQQCMDEHIADNNPEVIINDGRHVKRAGVNRWAGDLFVKHRLFDDFSMQVFGHGFNIAMKFLLDEMEREEGCEVTETEFAYSNLSGAVILAADLIERYRPGFRDQAIAYARNDPDACQIKNGKRQKRQTKTDA